MGFQPPEEGAPAKDLGMQRVTLSASRNSLLSRVFETETENRGVQKIGRGDLSRKGEKTERKQEREKEKEEGPTSS